MKLRLDEAVAVVGLLAIVAIATLAVFDLVGPEKKPCKCVEVTP